MATRKIGPCGGPDGGAKDMNISGISHILSITVGSGTVVDSIQVSYIRNGRQEDTERWGGDGGSLHQFHLRDDEYIATVKGYVGYFQGHSVVNSLRFVTNLGVTFGPFGQAAGMPFELSAPKCQIIGFHGHSGAYLDALGVYIKSLP